VTDRVFRGMSRLVHEIDDSGDGTTRLRALHKRIAGLRERSDANSLHFCWTVARRHVLQGCVRRLTERDDAAPGGALVFELWQQDGQEDSVRTYYVVQTPNQMRNPSRATVENVPAKAVIFLSGCSGAGSPCSARAFFSLVDPGH
jgi:hypothetical protein